jgi:Domain of unknown function DUF29
MPVKSPLYDRDFYAWSREQAERLRAGKLAEADIEHAVEERAGAPLRHSSINRAGPIWGARTGFASP